MLGSLFLGSFRLVFDRLNVILDDYGLPFHKFFRGFDWPIPVLNCTTAYSIDKMLSFSVFILGEERA